MKGKYTIIVKSHRVTYTLDIERNITIIRGDSATGKTSLIQSLTAYEDLKEKSGVTVGCAKTCHVIRNGDWEAQLEKWSDSIVFADEGNAFITSEAFAKAIRGSDNYYVLITRESLFQLPYSINAVLELKKTTSKFKHTYTRTYPYYHLVPELKQKISSVDRVITEDSNAGHQWFTAWADRYGVHCLSAKGKTALFDKLIGSAMDNVMIVADGAAFGAEMERIYQYTLLHPDSVMLYLPESFEWIILRSGLLQDKDISKVLEKTWQYADSTEYFSWEQFFTDYLIKASAQTIFQYQKNRLNPAYLLEKNMDRMESVIENG